MNNKKYLSVLSVLTLFLSLIPFSAFADRHRLWKTILHVKNATHSECQLIQIDTDHDEFDQALLEKPIKSGDEIRTRLKQRKKSKPEIIKNKITYQCDGRTITLQFDKKREECDTFKACDYLPSPTSPKVLSHDLGINAKYGEHWVVFQGNYVYFKIFDEK